MKRGVRKMGEWGMISMLLMCKSRRKRIAWQGRQICTGENRAN